MDNYTVEVTGRICNFILVKIFLWFMFFASIFYFGVSLKNSISIMNYDSTFATITDGKLTYEFDGKEYSLDSINSLSDEPVDLADKEDTSIQIYCDKDDSRECSYVEFGGNSLLSLFGSGFLPIFIFTFILFGRSYKYKNNPEKKGNALLPIGVVCVIAGIAIIVTGIKEGYEHSVLTNNGKQAKALVYSQLYTGDDRYILLARYTVNDKNYIYVSDIDETAMLGETIDITYYEKNPALARTTDESSAFIYILTGLGLTGLGALIVLFKLILKKGAPIIAKAESQPWKI